MRLKSRLEEWDEPGHTRLIGDLDRAGQQM